MENFLKKLATNSLNMAVEEYELMRDERGQEWVIDEIQKRCQEKGLAVPNVRSLKESLQKDQTVAARTHSEWQPSEVRSSSLMFVEITISLCRRDTALISVLLSDFIIEANRLAQAEGQKAGFLANVCLSKQSNHIAGGFKIRTAVRIRSENIGSKEMFGGIDGPLASQRRS